MNANWTLHTLPAARVPGVPSVVLASSCAVSGDNGEMPLQETSTPRSLSPYAALKLAAATT